MTDYREFLESKFKFSQFHGFDVAADEVNPALKLRALRSEGRIMIDPLIYQSITQRINTARDIYGPLASTHEGLGVALEEWDELLKAIHANDAGAIRREACDLAAIAIRLAEACAEPTEVFAARSGFTTGGKP